MRGMLVGVWLCASLAACGECGNGASSAIGTVIRNTATAGGPYSDTDAVNETITGVVLSNSAYYVFVGLPYDMPSMVGSVTGAGAPSNGLLTSASDRLYEQASSMGYLQHSEAGQEERRGVIETSTLTVYASGQISAKTSAGCIFTGTATRHGNRRGVYDITLSFGPGPCRFANASFSGITVLDPASMTLLAALPDGANTDDALFTGRKRQASATSRYGRRDQRS